MTPQILYNTADSATRQIYQHATTMTLAAIIAVRLAIYLSVVPSICPFGSFP
ncbi:hypothetical protein [Sporomusa silvacetica]|uniref:hypothetical protein n=1 Tax=Sporomusa silvacetica TaxID=55504 RepID=UPI00146B2C09|nr:hypothetical protein [Sporomusa silvacetica]